LLMGQSLRFLHGDGEKTERLGSDNFI
jgi:hypothetical protein